MPASITLERQTTGVMELRRSRFDILLDGTQAGTIDRNQTTEHP